MILSWFGSLTKIYSHQPWWKIYHSN